MKIARLVDSYPNDYSEINRGLMPNAYYLSTLQAKMGHQVNVYTYRRLGESAHQVMDGVNIFRVKKPPLLRTLLGQRICNLIQRQGFCPHIIHAMNPLPFGWLFPKWSRDLGARTVLSIHTPIFPDDNIGGFPTLEKVIQIEFKALSRTVINNVDLVIAVSRWIAREVRKSEQSRGSLKIIPSGVDLELFDAGSPVKDGICRILFVGRFAPAKGIDILLDAFQEIQDKVDCSLSLLGGTPEDIMYERVMERVSSMNTPSVRALPPVPYSEIAQVYASHDLLVLPSLNEGLGKVIIEAQACGLPVIATRVGGIPDIVTDGRNGILVPPLDVEALAENMKILCESEQMRRTLGNQGKKRSRSYDWNRIADQYSNAFEHVRS